jgi:hypothetical protein
MSSWGQRTAPHTVALSMLDAWLNGWAEFSRSF